MYIMLLKYCYSFSAITACTNGRSLTKAKLNRLINSVCLPVRSVTKKMKREKCIKNYTVKTIVHGVRKISPGQFPPIKG